MSAYCTTEYIIELLTEQELINLTDDGSTGEVNAAIVEQEIQDAAALIDLYTGPRYGIPLSPVPDVVRKLAGQLVVYGLYQRRRGASEKTVRDRDNAIRILEQVTAGKISFASELATDTITPAPTPEAPIVVSRQQIFTEEFLGKY